MEFGWTYFELDLHVKIYNASSYVFVTEFVRDVIFEKWLDCSFHFVVHRLRSPDIQILDPGFGPTT